MVTDTISVTESVSSETASVKVTVVSCATAGAVNVVERAVSSARVIDRAESWVHM